MCQMLKDMRKKPINRLKAILAEQGKTNKWLAVQLKKSETTTSRWCSNQNQPSVENMLAISKLLSIDVKDILHTTKK